MGRVGTIDSRRVRIFEITEDTILFGIRFKCVLAKEAPSLADRLFNFLMKFPETKKLLEGRDIKLLKALQVRYWSQLFDCKFDVEYVRVVHSLSGDNFLASMPINFQMAVQSNFQAEAYRLCSIYFSNNEATAACTAVMRIINLDTAINCAAYLRKNGVCSG